MLVARLGLRSIEAARLQLDDLDWRAGRIVLRGKASREDGCRCPPMSGRISRRNSAAREAAGSAITISNGSPAASDTQVPPWPGAGTLQPVCPSADGTFVIRPNRAKLSAEELDFG
jgi:integrase